MNNLLRALLLITLLPAALEAMANDSRYLSVPVFYATDRKIDNADKPEKFFGGERGLFSFGIVEVGIDRQQVNATGLEDISRWSALEVNRPKNKNGHFVHRVDPVSRKVFNDLVSQGLPGAKNRDLLVYLHGYKMKFGNAAINTAQFAYEAGIDGSLVLYSWPSLGKGAAYVADLISMEWSVTNLTGFIRQLNALPGVGKIHLLAHSMGNRGLNHSLMELSHDDEFRADNKIGEIVLLAPDLDADTFHVRVFPRIALLNRRMTLYVSNKDLALQTSKRLSRYHRLGDANGKIVVIPPMQTIDVSEVSSVTHGHTAHRNNELTRRDLNQLLNHGEDASERDNLTARSSAEGDFWVLGK